jgi:hypothetical protein
MRECYDESTLSAEERHQLDEMLAIHEIGHVDSFDSLLCYAIGSVVAQPSELYSSPKYTNSPDK